jgi:hypothetical protein
MKTTMTLLVVACVPLLAGCAGDSTGSTSIDADPFPANYRALVGAHRGDISRTRIASEMQASRRHREPAAHTYRQAAS